MNVNVHKQNLKAKYLAMEIIKKEVNKNLGLSYESAINENIHIKQAIDFWIKDILNKQEE